MIKTDSYKNLFNTKTGAVIICVIMSVCHGDKILLYLLPVSSVWYYPHVLFYNSSSLQILWIEIDYTKQISNASFANDMYQTSTCIGKLSPAITFQQCTVTALYTTELLMQHLCVPVSKRVRDMPWANYATLVSGHRSGWCQCTWKQCDVLWLMSLPRCHHPCWPTIDPVTEQHRKHMSPAVTVHSGPFGLVWSGLATRGGALVLLAH